MCAYGHGGVCSDVFPAVAFSGAKALTQWVSSKYFRRLASQQMQIDLISIVHCNMPVQSVFVPLYLSSCMWV